MSNDQSPDRKLHALVPSGDNSITILRGILPPRTEPEGFLMALGKSTVEYPLTVHTAHNRPDTLTYVTDPTDDAGYRDGTLKFLLKSIDDASLCGPTDDPDIEYWRVDGLDDGVQITAEEWFAEPGDEEWFVADVDSPGIRVHRIDT